MATGDGTAIVAMLFSSALITSETEIGGKTFEEVTIKPTADVETGEVFPVEDGEYFCKLEKKLFISEKFSTTCIVTFSELNTVI